MVSVVDAETWRSSNHLHELYEPAAQRASARKLRLFAVACCRRIAGWQPGPRSLRALEVAERYADGLATEEELALAELEAFEAAAEENERPASPLDGSPPWSVLAVVASRACNLAAGSGVYHALEAADFARKAQPAPHSEVWPLEQREEAAQCDLLREVVGPAAYRPVFFDPVWALREDRAARRLAETIYDEGAWELMPILADALEEAGCGDEELLAHARSEGAHVRGCWVVDLVLGRE
jgi:hypothetical protein